MVRFCTLTPESVWGVLTFGNILWSKIPHNKAMAAKCAPKKMSGYLERISEGKIKITDICVFIT